MQTYRCNRVSLKKYESRRIFVMVTLKQKRKLIFSTIILVIGAKQRKNVIVSSINQRQNKKGQALAAYPSLAQTTCQLSQFRLKPELHYFKSKHASKSPTHLRHWLL